MLLRRWPCTVSTDAMDITPCQPIAILLRYLWKQPAVPRPRARRNADVHLHHAEAVSAATALHWRPEKAVFFPHDCVGGLRRLEPRTLRVSGCLALLPLNAKVPRSAAHLGTQDGFVGVTKYYGTYHRSVARVICVVQQISSFCPHYRSDLI